jgi:hypothetical protein
MPATKYLRDKQAKHTLGIASFTMPTTIYVAAFTAMPTVDAASGTEVTGGSYARQAVAWTFGATGSGSASNTDIETFTNMPACTVVAAAFFDALTSGNMLLFEELPTPKVITLGANLTIPVGVLTVTAA